ncbi:MAG: hypothetical protein HRT89_05040 [Lentisphaeria bacterium]|nr:hypothetical protein [Lentisphaeria bacterium]NQZ67415.1 hypothetical protein [Lentisphaeria bacterium]
MKSIIICVCLLAISNLAAEENKAKDYAKSLSNRLKEFHKEMGDKSIDVQKKALQDILPRKADLKILFPKDADMLWKKLEAHYKNLIKHIDKVAAELTGREWTKIRAIDVRENDVSERYGEVLKLIPKNIPVFRVVKKSKKGSAGSSSYLFLDERWIHFQGLEVIPEIISQKETKK